MIELRAQIIRAILQGAALSTLAGVSLTACETGEPIPTCAASDINGLEVLSEPRPQPMPPYEIPGDSQNINHISAGRYIVCADTSTLAAMDVRCGDISQEEIDAVLVDISIHCSTPTVTKPEDSCGPVQVEAGKCCYAVDIKSTITQPDCVEGRPFIVNGVVRRADCAEHEGWSDQEEIRALAQAASALNQAQREQVAAHWANAGCSEHASIASFSKFLMELLSLGAPRALVEGTTQAIRDEIEHATSCFNIASAYAGVTLGPLKVDIQDSLNQSHDIVHILRAVIEEGCVGESLAAAQALHESQHAQAPQIKAALLKIHQDELEHALLAWRFVGWLLAERPELVPVAKARFETLSPPTQPGRAEGVSDTSLALMAHGCTPEYQIQQWRARAFENIVTPCAAELMALYASTPLHDAYQQA